MQETRFTPSDWKHLRMLRDRFLTDAREEYWTPRDLELYDATFAQRIGWKWDAVLATLDRAGWRPASTKLLDWGCGTGVAARTVAGWSGIRTATVFDQTRGAASFAATSLRTMNVGAHAESKSPTAIPPGTLLLISHVAGELDDAELESLSALAATAEEVLWVEPGSREISRRLSHAHEILRMAGLEFVAPCTHQLACPMLTPEFERDWCHFFASPPPEIFQSAFWREFSTRLEIDLRALPYSFLAATRHPRPLQPANAERVIGRPRELKAHAELLCCGVEGLRLRTLQKRDAPDLFRRLAKKGPDGVFVWKRHEEKPDRILGEL